MVGVTVPWVVGEPCFGGDLTSCPVAESSQPATQNLGESPNVTIVLIGDKINDIIHFIGAIGTNAW